MEDIEHIAATAKKLANQHTAAEIGLAIKVYTWALDTGLAKGPGYLATFLRARWPPPTGFPEAPEDRQAYFRHLADQVNS